MVVIKTDEWIDLPACSVPELHLRQLTAERARLTAYVDAETGKSMTFGQWLGRSANFAAALADKAAVWGGLKRGDCVGVVCPNHLDWPTVYMVCLFEAKCQAMVAGLVLTPHAGNPDAGRHRLRSQPAM